jgi:hypothetical protein
MNSSKLSISVIFSIMSLLLLSNQTIAANENSIDTKNSTLKKANLVSINYLLSDKQKQLMKNIPLKSEECSSSASKYQQSGNGPAIVGEYIETSFESPSPYTASTEAGGSVVWQTNIHHSGASYIAPFFKSMELSDGDSLVIRSPDKSRSWTYTKNGPRDLGVKGGFWGIHIHGDTAIIELHSTNSEGAKGIYISRFARGFTLAETNANESLCTTDDSREAKCYENTESEMYDKSRAVARLVKNGNAHCTGWLVGDEGHLITNEHCITDQAEADQITIEFMAEGPDCATNCASALGCPGIIEATAPTLIQDNGPLDYALILPTSTVNNLPNTYGFMQLRDSGAVLDEQLYIPQHPAGWGKRIAFESTYPADTTGFGVVASITEPACSGGSNDVGYWLDTQGGSSGSPVLGYDDHKVIALHHCRGTAGCAAGSGGEEPNRGVPIQAVIADLGANLPNGATCDTPDVPTNISTSAPVNNQISVTWTEPAGGSFSYDIYRTLGNCGSSTAYELIASNVSGASYNDTNVSGGSEYAYKVKTFDAAESCRSAFSSCSTSTATGLCTLAPTFSGLSQATNLNQNDCSIQLDWQPSAQNCGTASVFNVYRSTDANFTPSASNLISSCETNTSYLDQDILGATSYSYIVRAEDDTNNGSGLCATGNEDGNTLIQSALATGPNATVFTDDLEAGTVGVPLAGWVAEEGSVSNPASTLWSITDTNANTGTKSFFIPDQASVMDQVLRYDSIVQPQAGSQLEFWHRYNTESGWDGGALEYSTDGGTTWFDILDGNGGTVSANTNRFIMNGYDSPLNASTSNAPLNGRPAWHGDNGTWEQVQVDLNDFSGLSIELRWRMSADASVSGEGWYVDDISVFTPSSCQIFNEFGIFSNGFEGQ